MRENITSAMWEQINKFYLMVQSASFNDGPLDVPHNFFTEIKMASHLYVGIADSTMSHGEGWHFGHLRQLLERADKTARILDGMYYMLLPAITAGGASNDDVTWSAVLKSASGFEMYRRRHGMISPQQVANFLMLDREFPRSMHYCVGRAEESLHAISGSAVGTFQNAAE